MKKSIRLTESNLKRIIKESVKAILKENNQNDLLNNTINTLRNDKSVAFENTNSNKIKGTIPSSTVYENIRHSICSYFSFLVSTNHYFLGVFLPCHP